MPEPCIPHQAQAQGMWHDEKFHDIGGLTKGKEPEGDPGGKGETPFLGKEAVMMIYSR
jgi:hypothetical protein